MSKKFILIRLVAILALVFVIVQCGKDQKNPVAPIQTPSNIKIQEGVNGTTLINAVKTATGYLTRTYNWTITKSVTPAHWDLFKGDDGTSEYTATVTKVDYTDVVSVSGTIIFKNDGAEATEGLTIYDDVLYKTGPGQFQVLKTVQVSTEAKPVLEPGETYSYPYEVEFIPVAGAQYKNNARITITNHSGHLGEPFGPSPDAGFTVPTTPNAEKYGEINVTDSDGKSWGPVSETTTWTYEKTFTEAGTFPNTATIDELPDQTASAEVTVSVYELTVTKDAETSYDRNWTWDVDKSADQSDLTLATGEQFLVNYTVAFTRTYTDDNRSVNGNITVHNPASMAATINGLADVVSTGITADVTCSVTFPYSLAAGGDLKCTYSAKLPDLTSRTNTATATLQNYSYDKDKNATASGTTDFLGTHSVVFGAPTNEFDECAYVSDDYTGSGIDETICADKTFTYERWVGPYTACGDFPVENTASFVTNDNGVTGSDGWTVDVTVHCAGGCTLTQGYWKTHSSHGPAPYDPNWDNKAGGDATLLGTVFSYYEVLMMVPKGGNAWIILAHQYIAAELNTLNGASMSAEVVAAFDKAYDLLLKYQGDMVIPKNKKEDRARAIELYTILDNYNNGLMGTPHCDE